jgi:ferric-dicitrate binding protein FerR (iron transport regulator)
VGSRRRHQLERRLALPGPLCRGPGCHRLARVRCGACAKKIWRARFNHERTNKSRNLVEEPGDKTTRRFFLAAAGAAGLAYTAALAYPIYRYLASPEEMAMEATAVTEVTLKDAQKLPLGSVLMFKFGTAPGHAHPP